MSRRGSLATGLLLLGGLALALLGQVYFFHRRDYFWDGVAFHLLGLLLLLLAWRRLGLRSGRPRPPATGFSRWVAAHPLRVAALLWSLVLNVWAARAANATPPPSDFRPVVLLWLLSVGLFIAAVIRVPEGGLRRPRAGLRSSPAWGLVLALVLVGFFLRAWDLEHIPANLGGDEGTQGMAAVDVLEGRLRNPFATGWFSVPTMSFFAQALSLRLFGRSVAGLRMLSALIGTATLLLTYLLVRQLFGRRIALVTLALLTFNHYHLHFSRLGSNQIADPFFATLAFWPLAEALGRRRRRDDALWPFLLAGLAMGAGWYGYFGARIIPIIGAAWVGLQALTDSEFGWHRRGLIVLLAAAFLVASPLLLYYVHHPDTLTARYNQVGIFPSGWLAREVEKTGQSAAALLWQQFRKAITAFNYTTDPTFWYRARIPLLDLLSGLFFPLGLLWAMVHWRERRYQLLLLWFWLALLAGWVLTENPPSSMRMLGITPVVATFAALGLVGVAALGRRLLGGSRRAWRRGLVLVLIVVAFLNGRYYFFDYTPSRVYGNPTAEVATELGRYLAAQEGRPVFYFYGPPFMYADFGSLRFLAPHARGVDVPPANSGQTVPPDAPPPDLVVLLAERAGELNAAQARYPGGPPRAFRSTADGRLLFLVYRVERPPAP